MARATQQPEMTGLAPLWGESFFVLGREMTSDRSGNRKRRRRVVDHPDDPGFRWITYSSLSGRFFYGEDVNVRVGG